MKKTIFFIASVTSLSLFSTLSAYANIRANGVMPQQPEARTIQPSKTVSLKYSEEQIFDFILQFKNKSKVSTIPLPRLRLKSQTSLKEFQDAIEGQWGQRPAEITNAYIIALNEIYLMDDADYYQKLGRCLDDSLAHELTHFYQVKYQGYTPDGNDDFFELDAIEIQTAFREKFCQ